MIKRERKLLPYALIWLVCLGSFFFISYGFATWVTVQRFDVGSVVFAWEREFIPLWAWTIVPYWSIDLLYGLAFLLALSRKEIKTLGLRLLTAQLICVGSFLLYPLRFSWERPPLDGFFGLLFDILMGFDKPFNQAPSLHITLLIILWVFYSEHVPKAWRYLLHSWFFLIGLSVLTTWQHHFIDVPIGVLVGVVCIWLWSQDTSSFLPNTLSRKWALFYFSSALVVLCFSVWLGGGWLWGCWLAATLVLVAINYSYFGAGGFAKKTQTGRLFFPLRLIFSPYTVIMRINVWCWTYRDRPANLILDQVYLGRFPSSNTLKHYKFSGIVDLCAEFSLPRYEGNYCLIPVLDMTTPTVTNCEQAVIKIEAFSKRGTVLVCCALGYSRSATVIIAWLLFTKKVTSIDEAIELIAQKRPMVVINIKQRAVLEEWHQSLVSRHG